MGRIVLTGIRSAESVKRAGRRMVEQCYKDRSKTYLHPIIDWSDSDVWDFIHKNKMVYCKLYDEGFKRIGCIGCPMVTNQKDEFKRWPHAKKLYLHAFSEMLKERRRRNLGNDNQFMNIVQLYKWWIGDAVKKADPDQTVMFE